MNENETDESKDEDEDAVLEACRFLVDYLSAHGLDHGKILPEIKYDSL